MVIFHWLGCAKGIKKSDFFVPKKGPKNEEKVASKKPKPKGKLLTCNGFSIEQGMHLHEFPEEAKCLAAVKTALIFLATLRVSSPTYILPCVSNTDGSRECQTWTHECECIVLSPQAVTQNYAFILHSHQMQCLPFPVLYQLQSLGHTGRLNRPSCATVLCVFLIAA